MTSGTSVERSGDVKSVGFIGLGSQGLPMAHRIVDGGYELHLWARRPTSVAPFSGKPIVVEDTPAALGAACQIVGLCVVNDDDVRQVAFEHGLVAAMAPGSILAVHATVTPGLMDELAAAAEPHGVDVIDAPVSGGEVAAAEGHLTVMCGGDPAVIERARPVLETFGDPVRRLGGLGSGLISKILNNGLFTANLGLAHDTIRIGTALGLDPAALTAVLITGSASSTGLISHDRLFTPAGATHGGRLLEKDVRLLREMTTALGASTVERVAAETVDLLVEASTSTD